MEAHQKLSAALSELPITHRSALVLHEVQGLSHQEIGALLGCREGTVKSRIHRGRRRLQRLLAPYYGGELP